MTILEAMKQLRDDLKLWVTNNLRVKMDKNLGTEESGKLLAVDEEGNVVASEKTLEDIKETFVINVDTYGVADKTYQEIYNLIKNSAITGTKINIILCESREKENDDMADGSKAPKVDYYYYIGTEVMDYNDDGQWNSLRCCFYQDSFNHGPKYALIEIPVSDETLMGDNAKVEFTSTCLGNLNPFGIDAFTVKTDFMYFDSLGDDTGETTGLSSIFVNEQNSSTGESYHELRALDIDGTENVRLRVAAPIEDHHAATKAYVDNKFVVDSIPTEGSTNPISSGAMHTELSTVATAIKPLFEFVITVGLDGVADRTYEDFLEEYNIGCTNFVVEQVVSENSDTGDIETRRYAYGGADIGSLLTYHKFFCIEDDTFYECSFYYTSIQLGDSATDLTSPIEVSFSMMEPSAKKLIVQVEDGVAQYTYREISEMRQALGNGELVIQQKIGTVDYSGLLLPKYRVYSQVREFPLISEDGTEFLGWSYGFTCPENDAIYHCTLDTPLDTDSTYDDYATLTFEETSVTSGEYSCHTVQGVEYSGTYAEMYYNKDEYSMPKLKAGEPVESWHAATKQYVDSSISAATQSIVTDIYFAGTEAPDNKKLLWIDTAATTGGLKYYDEATTSWLHVPVAFT